MCLEWVFGLFPSELPLLAWLSPHHGRESFKEAINLFFKGCSRSFKSFVHGHLKPFKGVFMGHVKSFITGFEELINISKNIKCSQQGLSETLTNKRQCTPKTRIVETSLNTLNGSFKVFDKGSRNALKKWNAM